jgi:hypothetical protein
MESGAGCSWVCIAFFEIGVGNPAKGEVSIPTDVPWIVSDLIKTGLSRKSRRESSFIDIFEILNDHNFEIMAGVDSAEVLTVVKWVEFLQRAAG